jgi:hypothetical protein
MSDDIPDEGHKWPKHVVTKETLSVDLMYTGIVLTEPTLNSSHNMKLKYLTVFVGY